MFTKKTRVVILGALVLSSVAWAAPDFSAQMNTLATALVGGDAAFAFFAPATADLNENGVLDATEFALLEALYDSNAAVAASHSANYDAVEAALDDNVTLFLTAPVQDAYYSVLAAYVTTAGVRGGEKQYNVLNTVLSASNAFLSAPLTHVRSDFDESQAAICGVCGDADSDGVLNLHEALAAASEGAYVTAAQAAGTTASGADTLGGCNFVFAAEPGPIESRHWYYNPANGNVYFVGSDFQGNLFPTQIAGFAGAFTINGLLIPDAHPVRINDASENTFLAGLRTLDNDPDDGESDVDLGDAWTGANDATTEGQWRWADGTQFWQGAAAGSAVGGLYTNWNGGEPNDASGEDWHEIRFGAGGWNDGGADDQQRVIIEFEGDYVDTNMDGTPDGWTDNNNDGLPDGFTTSAVTITPADPVVKASLSIELTANSSPGDTEWTWSSGDTDIATVEMTGKTVDVTGVSPGTVTISVEVTASTEGKELGSTGQILVTVIPAEWFDLCDDDNIFAAQLATLAGFGLDGEDQELGVGDGVPDSWQVQLLAYALCKGGSGVPAEATAAYNANIAGINGMLPDIATNYAPFVGNINDQLTAIEALRVKFAPGGVAAACDGFLAGNGVPSIADALQDVVDEAGLLGQLASAHLILSPGFVGSGLAALSTTSSEMGITLTIALDGLLVDDLQDAVDGIAALLGAINGFLGGCPGSVAADAGAIYAGAFPGGTTVPSIPWPSWVAAEDPAKAAGEPLAGAGDYNDDGLTNAQVAAIVASNGGDANDFVIAATGDFGPFWPGNPNLPVGIAVLGGLVGAFAVGGAVSIRRRRKS